MTAIATTEVLHCNFCKRDSAVTVVYDRAVTYCPWCGSNNLVRNGTWFIGPPAKF
jgi:hypothetical protein